MSVWNTQQPCLTRSTPSHDLPPPESFPLLSPHLALSASLEACGRVPFSCFPWFSSLRKGVVTFSSCLSLRHSCNPSSPSMQSFTIFVAKCWLGLNHSHFTVSGLSFFGDGGRCEVLSLVSNIRRNDTCTISQHFERSYHHLVKPVERIPICCDSLEISAQILHVQTLTSKGQSMNCMSLVVSNTTHVMPFHGIYIFPFPVRSILLLLIKCSSSCPSPLRCSC